jgi:predicted acylesterase/phospholipase RssA
MVWSSISCPNGITKFWTLSFSGAGHLLPYHLGVAKALIGQHHVDDHPDGRKSTATTTKPSLNSTVIRAIAGSSSGAIAATIVTLMPHRLDEYTDRFLQDRGHAFRNLQELLLEQAGPTQQHRHQQQQPQSSGYIDDSSDDRPSRPMLVIGTTRCSDGALHLFSYGQQQNTDLYDSSKQHEHILRAVQASCSIPRFFHPVDVISKYDLSYPDDDGVVIDGISYVDGGIAAPAPPTPLDSDYNCLGRIIVSPISGGVVKTVDRTTLAAAAAASSPVGLLPSSKKTALQIRPKDISLALPFQLTARCRTFQIRPSIQNIRALVVAMGVASPGVLKDWYDRGYEDGQLFLDSPP